jgi:hypothetical protein
MPNVYRRVGYIKVSGIVANTRSRSTENSTTPRPART